MKIDGPKGYYTVRATDHVLLQAMMLLKLKNVTGPRLQVLRAREALHPRANSPALRGPGCDESL